MSTIKDVAKTAGVSVATVSRALNGGEQVRGKTKDKIMEAIAQLDYRPNYLGRNLRLQRTGMIIVIINSIANNFYAAVVKGVEDEARKNGYNVMLCAVHEDSEIEAAYVDLLKNKAADGAIFMYTTQKEKELLALNKSLPIVQCSEHFNNNRISYVGIDNRRAAFETVSCLIGQGRKRIAHITVGNKNLTTTERFKGYRDALKKHGLAFDERLVGYGNYGYRSAYAVMEKILDGGGKPDAAFAISDRMAAGAVKCTIDKGLRVPADIAVFGFDNTDITAIYNPTIATVSQSQNEMGRSAVQILLDRINGEETAKQVILGHEIIMRQSALC